jgi:hypothetical protein
MARAAAGPPVDPPLDRLMGADDPWYAVNASRATARRVVAGQDC